jgi:predicted O-linked N-acetylglucosamine transferase (SPINDLY family)
MSIPQDAVGQASRLVHEGRLPEAREVLRRFLAGVPAHPEALHLAGVVELGSGDPAAAIAHLSRCVELAPRVPFAWSNLGVAFNATGDFTNALACFRKTLELEPGNATAIKNQGIALRRLGRHDEAMASFRRAAQRAPGDFELHREVGDLLADMGRFFEAIGRYDHAIALQPRDAISHHNRGFAAWRAGDGARAIEDIGRSLAIAPEFARAHSTLGSVLADLGSTARAVECHERAVALDPREPSFHVGLAIALSSLARDDEAIAACDRALALDPGNVAALACRGTACRFAGRDAEALESHERAFALAPERPYAAGNLLLARLALCDWRGYEELLAGIVAGLGEGRLCAAPMALMATPVSAALLRRSAELHAGEMLHGIQARPFPAAQPGQRIRVGYFSADFAEHPVAQLLAPLIEHRDGARFEAIAFSFGREARGPTHQRLRAAFDRFEDVADAPDAEVAARARGLGLDIAIDLMGYTGRERTAVFAHRPAPVQAQFLGFAGTMGAACIDYLIADATVIPDDARVHYSEKIVALPDTALVAQPLSAIAATPARESIGLADAAFVFSCFCNRNKVTPDVFDAWMALLREVRGSVLWLARARDAAAANLRAEAEARGVDPARLVFAERTARVADHLARLGAADLHLDTFHYNGHVTTSDALLAGLPVLTLQGRTFASRVSSSLLRAAGLPELVAASPEEYVELALRLARDPATLAQLRLRLVANRDSCAAFDVRRQALNLERGFVAMLERHRAGLAPEHVIL